MGHTGTRHHHQQQPMTKLPKSLPWPVVDFQAFALEGHQATELPAQVAAWWAASWAASKPDPGPASTGPTA